MNINDFTKKFFQMEIDCQLFLLKSNDNTYLWDCVRYDVFNYVYSIVSKGDINSSPISTGIGRRFLVILFKYFYFYLFAFFYFIKGPNYLILSTSRHKKIDLFIDVISDDIISTLDGTVVSLDTNRFYWKNIFILPLKKTVKVYKVIPTFFTKKIENTFIEAIKCSIIKHFKVSLDNEGLNRIIVDNISSYKSTKYYYKKLFRIKKPVAVFVVQAGIQKGLFEAANELKIPVIELQHGLANFNHAAYSYSKEIDYSHLHTFPKAFFTFSEYWNHQFYCPQVINKAIGNNYYNIGHIDGNNDNILIITTNIYHPLLSGLLCELSRQHPDKNFFYKLHPHHFHDKNKIISGFSGFDNVTVISNEFSVVELFSQCNTVILIQSTAIYEALQAGKNVCLYKKLSYSTHVDVFDYVTLFETADEIFDTLNSPQQFEKKVPIFFDRFNPEAMQNALKELTST